MRPRVPKLTTVGNLCIAICLLLGMSGLGIAAPNQLIEEDLPAPTHVVGPPVRPAPSNPVRPPAAAEEEAPPQPSRAVAQVPAAPAPAAGSASGSELSYTVREGDSPGSIAEMFHVDVASLLRANHMRSDVILRIGNVMRVPNPYAYEVSTLKAQVEKLNDQVGSDRRNVERLENDLQAAKNQAADLTASNSELQHDTRILPWWRKIAMTTSVAAGLMVGVTLIALLDWFLTRRRFRMLADMNESLRRLDLKYKTLLAKAELRFQQLYGRRRQGIPEGQESAKSPEDYEIEHLNRELKEVLEKHLERMGGRRDGQRHSWLRSMLGNVGAEAETRPTRR